MAEGEFGLDRLGLICLGLTQAQWAVDAPPNQQAQPMPQPNRSHAVMVTGARQFACTCEHSTREHATVLCHHALLAHYSRTCYQAPPLPFSFFLPSPSSFPSSYFFFPGLQLLLLHCNSSFYTVATASALRLLLQFLGMAVVAQVATTIVVPTNEQLNKTKEER